ncbi:MAG: PAS domain S-box protein [Candidatus Eisenbacteria bacterium]
MNWMRFRKALSYPLFFAALIVAAALREVPNSALNQAIIWLPTGVAITGLFMVGKQGWWVIALATLVQRVLLNYDFSVAVPAAAGSSAEAVIGVVVLERLGFRATLDRLRDIAAIVVAAMVAPLGSIFFSWIGRSFAWSNPDMPFYSGWDGWWRMNALGVLTVLPVTLTWTRIPRHEVTPRLVAGTLLAVGAIFTAVYGTFVIVPTGVTGVLLVNIVLAALVFYAAGRFGQRGATLASAVSAIAVASMTTRGYGPFLDVPREHRHVALQLFELLFITLPPGFAALVAERRAAEVRGARSDELRRSIQSALPDITYRLRRDGTCLEISTPPGVEPPFPHDQMIGRSIEEWMSPLQVTMVRERILAAFARGEAATVEFEVVMGGRTRMREARCVPHGDDELLAVVRDITDRRWSEGTTAFEANVLALVATGRPTPEVFRAITRGMERLMPGARCSIVTLEGRLMHVAQGESLPEAYNAAVEGLEIGPLVGSCGAAADGARTVIVADMTTSPLWARFLDRVLPLGLRACWSVPILASDGGVLGTFAIYHGEVREPDPHELALAERAAVLAAIVMERERRIHALRRSQDLLASINRNVKEGLFRTTPELELLYSNHALARIFGYLGPEELPRQSFEAAFVDAARREELARLIRETGEWTNEEVRFLRRDGSPFWGLLSGTAVRDEHGQVVHYDGAIADITERKELEAQFRQAQKMEAVGKLAGGVAHDFNNVLTVIYGCAEAIRNDSADTPAIRAQAEQVLDAASRATRLTRQLLAYSRQQVLSPRVLDLTVVVDQMSAMLRRLIGEDYRLTVEHASGPCWARVDPSQIEQVLLNLLVNARDAMPGGGPIVLRTEHGAVAESEALVLAGPRSGPAVRLCVRDEGAGMSSDVQARAFDPFFTTKPLGQGTGLGLSTVYGIVQQSGGAVWLDSAPGRGTSVWIALPQCEPPAGEPAETVAAPAPAMHGTVLVVEDEPGVRALVCMTLRRAGYDVIEAADGEAGLQAVAAHAGTIDLIVSDVVMPRLNGRDMAERLLQARPGLRFLFISGYPDDARSPQDFAGEASGFLAKPFTPPELLAAVRGVHESAPATRN